MHNFERYLPYKKQDIIKVVHGIGVNRKIKFRYDILNEYNQKIAELKDTISAEITCDNAAAIKKSMKISYRDTGNSFFINKLMPVVSFLMEDGEFLDFPQGVYIMGDISKKEAGNSLIIDLTMFDEIKRLDNEKTDYRHYIAAGTLYYNAIEAILNRFDIVDVNGIDGANHKGIFDIEYTSEALGVDREWEIGKSYLEILKDLLKDINYTDIWTDEIGVFRARKKKLLEEMAEEYIYQDNETSIQANGVINNSDYFDIPNKWIVTASNPDSIPITATLENQSDISFRGQTVTRFGTIDYIANKEALEEYVNLLAESDKVTEKIEFETGIAPFHDVLDVYKVKNKTHNLDKKYQESAWNMKLEIGAKMHHTAIRKVNLYD